MFAFSSFTLWEKTWVRSICRKLQTRIEKDWSKYDVHAIIAVKFQVSINQQFTVQTKQDKYLVLKGNEIVLAWGLLHVSDTIWPKIPVWISEIFVCRHQTVLTSSYSRFGTFLTKIYSTKCFSSQEFRMGKHCAWGLEYWRPRARPT